MASIKVVTYQTLLYFWQKLKPLLDAKQDASSAFSGSYSDLSNKPYINNVELSGAKSLADLGIQPAGNYAPAGSYATQNDIDTAIAGLVNSAPAALDTLKELSDALGGDANFATTVTTALGNKVNTSDLVEVTNAEVDTIMATSGSGSS